MYYFINISSSGKGLIRKNSEPRLLKDILHEMIHSNSPLSKDLREFLASKESIAEKGGNL